MLHRDLRFHTSSRDDAEFAQNAAWLVEGQIRMNMYEIEADGDDMPCCPACGGVKYVEPQLCKDCDPVKHPCQDVYDVRTMMEKGQATCYDLAAERAARLRLKGLDAHVVIDQRVDAYDRPMPGAFHAYVEVLDDGSTEDPAEELRLNPGVCAGGRACDCDGGHEDEEQGQHAIARLVDDRRVLSTADVRVLALPGRVA